MTTPTTPPPDQSPDKISPGKSLEQPGATPSKPASSFESYMRGASTPSQEAPSGKGTLAPGNAQQSLPAMSTEGPNFNTILAQARAAHDGLGQVEQQLKTPNLKFKRSQSHLLRNKLQDANTYLRSASSKLGIDAPPMKMPANPSPLDRFLAYINDGQEQMNSVQDKLKELSLKGEQLKPADLLFVQVRMNSAQQMIEFSSTLLSKVIDSIKTIINIQL